MFVRHRYNQIMEFSLLHITFHKKQNEHISHLHKEHALIERLFGPSGLIILPRGT